VSQESVDEGALEEVLVPKIGELEGFTETNCKF
jgi:hypothetical protein